MSLFIQCCELGCFMMPLFSDCWRGKKKKKEAESGKINLRTAAAQIRTNLYISLHLFYPCRDVGSKKANSSKVLVQSGFTRL